MRGTRHLYHPYYPHRGIIPADAGNTLYQINLDGLHRDHPRGCGEHVTVLSRSAPIMGSSPRMRGTLL